MKIACIWEKIGVDPKFCLTSDNKKLEITEKQIRCLWEQWVISEKPMKIKEAEYNFYFIFGEYMELKTEEDSNE